MEFALSDCQRGLWIAQQLHPHAPLFNAGGAQRFRGRQLDVEALRRALHTVWSRHPMMRATFHDAAGTMMQRIAERPTSELEVVDLAATSDDALLERMTEEVRRPFDLARSAVRATLFRLGDDDFVLAQTVHHIIGDLRAAGLAARDLSLAYARERGGDAELPPLPDATYADFVREMEARLAGPRGAEMRAFWKARLQGRDGALDLPTDRARGAVRAPVGETFRFKVDEDVAGELRALAARQSTTLFRLLLSAYYLFLSRYTSQSSLVVATDADVRGDRYANVYGHFINPLVLPHDVPRTGSFLAFLAGVEEATATAARQRDYPFVRLVGDLGVPRGRSLYETDFAVLRVPSGSKTGPLQGENLPVPRLAGQMDLRVQLFDGPAALRGELKYSPALFDAATAARMARHYTELLRAIARAPESPLADLDLRSAEERTWLSTRSPAARPEPPTLLDAFEAQVQRTPDAPAIVEGARTTTYRELDELADRVAAGLAAAGIARGRVVGLRLPRSRDAVAAMLGVMRAGAAFAPIPPSYPEARVRAILDDVDVTAVITAEGHAALEPYRSLPFVSLAATPPAPGARRAASPGSLAYVIGTSGSTGRPKVVLVAHAGIPNFLAPYREALALGPGARLLHFLPLGFDAALGEIFACITSGAVLVVVPEGPSAIDALAPLVREHGVTAVTLPPSFLKQLDPKTLPSLARVISGGDAFDAAFMETWTASTTLVNAYGPTEATVTATMANLNEEGRITIGRPLPGVPAYVVDRDLRLAPVGVYGELCLGGIQVAHGYAKAPELTAERMVPDPFGTVPGARMYRTGDRVRWREDGTLDFAGRMDAQVKIRGFRVELGEIEHALAAHPAIAHAAVAVDERAPDPRLVAFFQPRATAVASELRAFLAERLPEVMVPAVFVEREGLPLGPNGKIDKRALLATLQEREATPAALTAAAAPALPPALEEESLEDTITRVWKKLLGVDDIVSSDDFFDLGGHSLLAMRVVAELETALGRKIPLVTLMTHSTVEELARALRALAPAASPPKAARPKHVVALGGPDAAAPLFLVHAVGGGVTHWASLAAALGQRFFMHGLTAPGLDGDASASTIEEIAEALVPSVEQVAKGRTAHVAGWSFGGLVALEIARKLGARGADVGAVVLVDTLPPGTSIAPETDEAGLRALFARHVVAGEAEGSAADARAAMFRAFRAHARAERVYAPLPYEGPTQLVLQRAKLGSEQEVAWRRVLPSADVEPVDAGHHELLREPAVRQLAALLAARSGG